MTDRKKRLFYLKVRFWDLVAPKVAGTMACQYFMRPERHLRPDWETKLLAQYSSVSFSGGLRAYQKGHGPRVILLHGWSGRGSQLAQIGQVLAERFHVLLLDGPAHGESAGILTNPLQFAQALDRVIAEVGPVRAVVGHSFGAAAAALALQRGATMGKLVYIAGPSNFGGFLKSYSEALKLSPRAKKRLYEMTKQVAGVEPDSLEISNFERLRDFPLFFVHDQQDKDVPIEEVEKLVRIFPQAETLFTSGLGHKRILRDPSVIQAISRFIA